MALKYALVENLLTERPDDYSAITYPVASIDKEGVIERITKRGTTLTKTDVMAVLNALEEVVVDALEQGYTINLPLFNTSFSISGVFESPMDSFDGNRHKLNINLTKGILLRETEKRVKAEKTGVTSPLPQIQEVKDCISGVVNDRMTANGVIEVRGYNLKIEGDDKSCGLWFVAEDGKETKADIIIENKPSRIMAMIPELKGGTYQIKVVSQFSGGGKFLKLPKTFTYPKSLQI